MAQCPARWLDREIHQRTRSCNLTRNEPSLLYDMGFRHFKIHGRDNIPYCFAYDLTRYTLEPGFAAPFIYKILCSMILRPLNAAQGQGRTCAC